MKIAFCLHGLAGGKNDRGSSVDFRLAHRYFKKHILDRNNVDVFIHSWSVDLANELKLIYAPKSSVFEKQIMFDQSPTKKHSTYSRWYSFKKAVELKKEYEIANQFVYDFVIVTRFDVLLFKDIYFQNFDTRYFYIPDWDGDKSAGISDLWFFSNSLFMDRFSVLYDNLDRYLSDCALSNHILAKYHLEKQNLFKYVMPLFQYPKDFAMARNQYPPFKYRIKDILRKFIIKLFGNSFYIFLKSKLKHTV